MQTLNPLDDLKRASGSTAAKMIEAAEMLMTVLAADQQRGTHVVGRLLPKRKVLRHWDHLPAKDVRDAKSGACWFYHVHAPDVVRSNPDEHGHFHLFIHRRHAARHASLLQTPTPAKPKPPLLSHLVALAMRPDGLPLRWFTVAQSATNDYVYPAAAMKAAAHNFYFAPRGPLAPTTRWLMAMVQLYQPTILRLLDERDRALPEMKKNQEIMSVADVRLADYMTRLEALI
jgi:hypothetical protein